MCIAFGANGHEIQALAFPWKFNHLKGDNKLKNEKNKKILYIIGAFVSGAAFVCLGTFAIDFSNGRIAANVLFSFLAIILACAASFLGTSAFHKETAQWDSRRWAKEMILPILLTIGLIFFTNS